MHPNAERVLAALRGAGAAGEIRELSDSARTATEAAAALGCPVGAIVKSLVFAADGNPLLVLTSGAHTVDTERLVSALDLTSVTRADAAMVRAATGFPIGGVAPVGHPAPLQTVVDTALGRYDVIWASAGTPHAVFPTTYEELLLMTGGHPMEVGA
jgi:prolyl-tRNA editing enzyme YbaK/EbsC (Cys-tRNA(Pro) deacylase)